MLCILLAACSDSLFDGDGGKLNGEDRIQLSGSIEQLALTRVCDNGFCDGDVMGVYVVDYNGGTPGTRGSHDQHHPSAAVPPHVERPRHPDSRLGLCRRRVG